jgi:GNAT superfamily N-acetyltransferase
MRIGRLCDHPDAVDPLAAAYEREWPEWYGPGNGHSARADLLQRMNSDRLPMALLALDAGEPRGTLAVADGAIRTDLRFSPAVIGLWVCPQHRRRGIATQLLHAASREVRLLGHSSLYAATASVAPLFADRGWTPVAADDWDGQAIRIFRRDL